MAYVALLVPASAIADLNGRWHWDFGLSGITVITDVGGAVSFDLDNGFGVVASFSGTVTGSTLNATAPPPNGFDCGLTLSATVSGDENSINGTIATVFPCSTPGSAMIRMQRCGCFDGNSNNGDGCSAQCQVEACYTCSGDPSGCTPLGDGTPCDDQSLCTTGEMCIAAMCGGGSPVSGCIDMSGNWRLGYAFIDDFIPDTEGPTVFTQRNTTLEAPGMRGTIDPFTGVFQLTEVSSSNGFCPGNHLSGQVATDGRSLTGNFTTYVMTPTQCPSFGAMVTGSRCGGGTLDVGEACDDGNWSTGDGCDANCAVEACYTCTIDSPSVCSPQPDGTGCDDGNGCTLSDACLSGICTGTAVSCGPCLTCTGAALCVAAPRTGCLRSTAPSRSTLFIRDATPDDRDVINWQWRRGDAQLAALGDPTQSTRYDFCLYDESTPQAVLVFRGSAQPGCPATGCWTSRARGFTYSSATGADDGLSRVDLRAQDDGRAKIVVKGKGPFLTHQFGVPTAPLTSPVLVQLQAVDPTKPTSTCFETEIDATGISRNEAGVFRARATGP